MWIPQWTVVFPPRERKFSISALTQSTAESGDCCDTCEWDLTLVVTGCSFQTERYAKEDMLGDLLKSRSTDDEMAELMETGGEDKRKIAELIATKAATEQALAILADL